MTGGRVVVLGPTGRNFGAGMSGGIAFVYDPDGTFFAPVNARWSTLEPLDPDDSSVPRTVVQRHASTTGSAVAERMLAAWTSRSAASRR